MKSIYICSIAGLLASGLAFAAAKSTVAPVAGVPAKKETKTTTKAEPKVSTKKETKNTPVVGVPPKKETKNTPVVGVPPKKETKNTPVVGVPPKKETKNTPVVGVPPKKETKNTPVVGVPPKKTTEEKDPADLVTNDSTDINIDTTNTERVSGFELPTELQPGYTFPDGINSNKDINIDLPEDQEVRGAQ